MAHAMRWVKETLPPRARLRWLLITMRLSIMSFAGMVRTLVAVGTLRLASMFAAMTLATPLSTWTELSGCGASVADAAGAAGACAGIGCGFAGAEVVRATGVLPVGGAGSTGASGVEAISS